MRIICLLTFLVLLTTSCNSPAAISTPAPTISPSTEGEVTMKLPSVRCDSNVSLEKTLLERRSVRDYADAPLTLEELSQLLWACQGITNSIGFRTAPSAGALYPLEVYAVVGNVKDLAAGIYRYEPEGHQITRTTAGDKRSQLADSALGQSMIEGGAVSFVITAVYERTTGKYGERGIRYVHMEVGHAGQNLCLEAVALGLGAVTVGAFYDDEVAKVLKLSENEEPLYIISVGRKK